VLALPANACCSPCGPLSEVRSPQLYPWSFPSPPPCAQSHIYGDLCPS
jgi:hypothetical protein